MTRLVHRFWPSNQVILDYISDFLPDVFTFELFDTQYELTPYLVSGEPLPVPDDIPMEWRFIDLSGANLQGANLQGANLNGASLVGAQLQGADLTEALLSEANLSGADFTGASLVEAKLDGTALMNTVFNGADLVRASFDDADPSDATYDEDTIWTDGQFYLNSLAVAPRRCPNVP